MGLRDRLFGAGGDAESQPDQQAHGDKQNQAQFDGRLVHVYYEGHNYDRIIVVDSDKTSVLYTADFDLNRWQLGVQSASTSEVIATVSYHLTTFCIDATIHGQAIALTSHGMRKSTYTYDSPALGIAQMTWKPRSWKDELDMVLLDDTAMPVARFMPAKWSTKKGGKMELLERCNSNGRAMDEVVATGLAAMHFKHLQYVGATIISTS
jgi:hypothetical protein